MLKTPLVLLKRDRFDDLRDTPRESRHYPPEVDASFPACQVVVHPAAVVVQVSVDRSSLFQERAQVAVDMGVPHIEGEPETAVGKAVEEPGLPEETDLPCSHVLEGDPDVYVLLGESEIVERTVEGPLGGAPHLLPPDVSRVNDQPLCADTVADLREVADDPDGRPPQVLVIGCNVDISDRGVDRIPEVERVAGLFFPEEGVRAVGEDLREARMPGYEGERFFERPVHQAAGGAADTRIRHGILVTAPLSSTMPVQQATRR